MLEKRKEGLLSILKEVESGSITPEEGVNRIIYLEKEALGEPEIGEVVEIVGRNMNHYFKLGEWVKIIAKSEENYYAQGEDVSYYIAREDFIRLAPPKERKRGDNSKSPIPLYIV